MIEGSLEVKLPTIWTDEKAEMGRVREERREEEKKIKKRKGEKKKKIQVREKGRKVAKPLCFFKWFCGSGGSKSRLPKAAGCGASWPDERWKIARRCGAKGHYWWVSKALFGRCDVEKVHAAVAQKHIFEVKRYKNAHMLAPLLDVEASFLRGRRKGLCTLSKVSKNLRVFVAFSKNGWAGVGDSWRGICKDTFFPWQAQYKRTCSSEMLGGEGADFLRRVAFLKHQICSFGKDDFCGDRCSTSYDLASTFFLAGAVL